MTITSIRPAMVLYRCPFCKRYYSMPNFYGRTEIYPPDEVITARILRGDHIMDNRCMDCFVKQEGRDRYNSNISAGRK
jgi:hypothetical protein